MEQSGQHELNFYRKKFMEADESQKAAILNGVSSVMDFQTILPVDLSTWSKKTTAQVLQKTLDLCEIPRSTEDKSYEEVQWEQDKLQRQLTALKKKKERTALLVQLYQTLVRCKVTLEENFPYLNVNLWHDDVEGRDVNEDAFRDMEAKRNAFMESYTGLQNYVKEVERILRAERFTLDNV